MPGTGLNAGLFLRLSSAFRKIHRVNHVFPGKQGPILQTRIQMQAIIKGSSFQKFYPGRSGNFPLVNEGDLSQGSGLVKRD